MCRLSKERKPDGGNSGVIGNETMYGQIVSFMENLHFTYREIFEDIPYRNLLLMQKDKLRVVYGEKAKEISGKEMLNKKRK